jgi:hypothetical protein
LVLCDDGQPNHMGSGVNGVGMVCEGALGLEAVHFCRVPGEVGRESDRISTLCEAVARLTSRRPRVTSRAFGGTWPLGHVEVI